MSLNCRLGGGSGLILLFRGLVLVLGVAILLPFLELLSSFLGDIITRGKTRGMPISMIPTFLTSMPINLPNLKYRGRRLLPDTPILQFWQVQKSLFSEEEARKAKYSEICMHLILLQ